MTNPLPAIPYICPNIPAVPPANLSGQRYERLAPATLDLAERARLALNGMTEPTDEETDYRIYWKVSFRFNPPVMYHDLADTGIVAEMMSAVPRMRVMSGSEQNQHVEQRWKEVLLHMISPDNMVATPMEGRPYFRPSADKMLHAGFHGHTDGDYIIEMDVHGQMIGSIATYMELDDREFWEPMGRKLTDSLIRLAVRRDGEAYFPLSHYRLCEYAEPSQSGPTGVLSTYGMWGAKRLVEFYKSSGYRPALDFAGELCRYIPHTSKYFGPNCEFHRDNEDPASPRHHTVHFHAHSLTALSCLEYALEANNQELLDFALRAFEKAKTYGNCDTGFFPESASYYTPQTCEICEVADMVRLAVRCAAAGLGDSYWDDADRWVRNQLVEGQLLRSDWIHRLHFGDPPSQCGPEMTTERVGERNIGGFAGWQAPNDWIEFVRREGTLHSNARGYVQGIMHCCTANGGRALYDVWRNIVHREGDRLTVNLLLNYADEFVDIDSHVPYIGQVDIHLKKPLRLTVRMPAWVKLSDVRCTVEGVDRALKFDGRYVKAGEIGAGQMATFTMPLNEKVHRTTIRNEWYFLVRKGHDVVFIDPPGKLCPLYQRDHYRGGATLWSHTRRFIAEKRLND